MQSKDVALLASKGSVHGLAKALRVDLRKGLDPAAAEDDGLEARADYFGYNELELSALRPFWRIIWENMQVRLQRTRAVTCSASNLLLATQSLLNPVPVITYARTQLCADVRVHHPAACSSGLQDVVVLVLSLIHI